ncbi:helix-turn-helix domain-containing protein [uncultured Ruthenibacterium sp.]|uniref:helix-turn-helix domain-containing protein n=1 Tax=uncultured Ruthenibacterium sp. TaxID=1905347 RepID=UPI00349EE934
MFKIKAEDGTNNLCGANVRRIRLAKTPRLSQRGLAARLQVMGYDVDHHMIRRIENGERFVTDIELELLAQALGTTINELCAKKDRVHPAPTAFGPHKNAP